MQIDVLDSLICFQYALRGFTVFIPLSAAIPLHSIHGSDTIVSSNSVHVSVHSHQTHSAAGAAQGCYICTPAVGVWVVSAMMEVREKRCQSVKIKSGACTVLTAWAETQAEDFLETYFRWSVVPAVVWFWWTHSYWEKVFGSCGSVNISQSASSLLEGY